MPLYRVTGLKAAIDGFACLKSWKFVLSGTDTVSACSASDGAVIRSAGNADWSGAAVGYGLPPKMPGETFTFQGSDRFGQGWLSATSATIVTRVHIFCPINSGKHIFYHLYFAANGSIAKGAYSVTDSANPSPLNAKGLTFKIDTVAVNGVEHWDMVLDGNVAHPSYPSHLAGWPARDPGNLDVELTWRQTFDAMDQIPTINSFHQFTPYVDSARYYDILWGQVLHEPVDVPIEGEPAGQAEYIRLSECKAKFTGWKDGVQGYFKRPGAVGAGPVTVYPV